MFILQIISLKMSLEIASKHFLIASKHFLTCITYAVNTLLKVANYKYPICNIALNCCAAYMTFIPTDHNKNWK